MAINPANAYTNRKVADVKRRLEAIYSEAEEDLSKKISDFWRGHMARDEKYRAMVANGEMSQEDYDAWMRGQIFQGNQWAEKRNQIVREMVNTDRAAQSIVNNGKLDIFATNSNYVGYDIEQGLGADIGFNLIDVNTVARLVRDEPDLLPAVRPEKIVEGQDVDWYQRVVRNSITQGIIQGDGVRDICRRILTNCADRGKSAAMRDARTAYTGAQNAGRIDGMRRAQRLGIDVRKRWMCTFDLKTRAAHRALDGITVDVDEPFSVDGETIKYPGDPQAKGYLVYNCRCTLGWIYPKYSHLQHINRRDNITGEDAGAVTYYQWLRQKMNKTGRFGQYNVFGNTAMLLNRLYTSNGLRAPKRPRQIDFNNENDYREARSNYRSERDVFRERLSEEIDKGLSVKRFSSMDEFVSWCNERGITVNDEILANIDLRALNETTYALDEMFERFPQVKSYEFEDIDGKMYATSFNIGTTTDGLLSANGGFNFNLEWFKDYYNGLSDALEGQTNGDFVRGDGTFSTLVRHEYGHNVDAYIRNRIALRYHYNVDDWHKNYKTLEEYKRASAEYRREMSRYRDELLALAGLDGSSDYSNTNELELFAEGFSEWASGSQTDFAREFGKFFERWYNY